MKFVLKNVSLIRVKIGLEFYKLFSFVLIVMKIERLMLYLGNFLKYFEKLRFLYYFIKLLLHIMLI
jgi:hypothetical protein